MNTNFMSAIDNEAKDIPAGLTLNEFMITNMFIDYCTRLTSFVSLSKMILLLLVIVNGE